MGIEIAETVPASRKLGEDRAKELIEGSATVFVAKGKKLESFDGGTASEDLVKKMVGSTGNLRAPTVVFGPLVLVGFNEELYREVLE